MRNPMPWRLRPLVPLGLLATLVASSACSGGTTAPENRVTGQTDFLSAPPPGASGSGATANFGGAPGAAHDSASTPAANATVAGSSPSTPRTVQETDLYRLDG